MSDVGGSFPKFTTDGVIDESGEYEYHLLRTDQDPVPTCICFVRSSYIANYFSLSLMNYFILVLNKSLRSITDNEENTSKLYQQQKQ